MITIVGMAADTLGAASQWDTVPYGGPGRNFDVKQRFFAVPAAGYRAVQPARLHVDVDHDPGRTIGEVRYLERTGRGLWAVCEIDASTLGDGPWFYSPEIRHRAGHDIELRSLAVTRRPASICLDPIDAFPGTVADAAYRTVTSRDGFLGEVVKRARDYDNRRKHDDPLVIQGEHPRLQTSEPTVRPVVSTRRVETRSAVAVDVHKARREVDMLVAPAEIPSTIHESGRSYIETFAHGAFRDIGDPARIKVNLHHDRARTIGKLVVADPWDERGLFATARLARIRDADEALELIDMGLLGCSAGFLIPPGGERWTNGTRYTGGRRRVERALLDHAALTPDPAHPAAAVIDVRGYDASRPNLTRARQILAGVR